MQNANCKSQNAEASTSVSVIRFRNTTDDARELWIEPLGDRVVLAPNALYELATTESLEQIDLSVGSVTVHGWVTRVSVVDDDGSMQTIWERPG